MLWRVTPLAECLMLLYRKIARVHRRLTSAGYQEPNATQSHEADKNDIRNGRVYPRRRGDRRHGTDRRSERWRGGIGYAGQRRPRPQVHAVAPGRGVERRERERGAAHSIGGDRALRGGRGA